MIRLTFTNGDTIPFDHALEAVVEQVAGGVNTLRGTVSGTGREMLINWDHVVHAEEFDDSSPERAEALRTTRPTGFDYDE